MLTKVLTIAVGVVLLGVFNVVMLSRTNKVKGE